MANINVQICGDHWINVEQVKTELQNAAQDTTIVIDMNTEGASLYALGIADTITNTCCQHGIDPKNILIDNWPNALESIPFTRVYTPLVSHFFWLSERYWLDQPPTSTHQYRFGFFVGRKTPSRATMLYSLYRQHGADFLFSAMQNRVPEPWILPPPGNYLEKLNEWLPEQQHQHFCNWWKNSPVNSLDQCWVSDQYNPVYNTNQSLLTHYHKFDIELVAETYTLGSTFFPTEKTVRPLMANRPMLVYGPKDFLKNLQQLGFKTYAEFWDESYDQLWGPARWHKINNVITKFLSQPKPEQINQVSAMQCVAIHNRQHLVQLIKKYRPT